MATQKTQIAGVAKLFLFVSDEIDGNASEQTTKHTLGRQPKVVFPVVVEDDGNAWDIDIGDVTEVAIKSTCTNTGVKYLLVAVG
jgi:hypothetical protein